MLKAYEMPFFIDLRQKHHFLFVVLFVVNWRQVRVQIYANRTQSHEVPNPKYLRPGEKFLARGKNFGNSQ